MLCRRYAALWRWRSLTCAGLLASPIRSDGFRRTSFTGPDRPSVLWAGIDEGGGELSRLASAAVAGGREFGSWRAERLMKSALTPRGPVYSVYESLPLG